MFELRWASLRVAHLERQSDFYQKLLGLEVLSSEAQEVRLAAGGREILRLHRPEGVRLAVGSPPGLFHLAFLLPDAGALGAWLNSAQAAGITLEGASDHGVSQAFYLSDPEGNGVEVYADRDRADWPRLGERLTMFTRRLDVRSLVEQATHWEGSGVRLGHIHLQTLDCSQGADFFASLGAVHTVSYPGAEFYGANGYHHHFAVNQWSVRPHQPGLWTGLSGYAVSGTAALPERDPWGHQLHLESALN